MLLSENSLSISGLIENCVLNLEEYKMFSRCHGCLWNTCSWILLTSKSKLYSASSHQDRNYTSTCQVSVRPKQLSSLSLPPFLSINLIQISTHCEIFRLT
uniref:Uncharacterized protein n=1 Tax=Schistocephalus solidus TaxID=70667 RepID=A0A0X3NPT4_SCHSO